MDRKQQLIEVFEDTQKFYNENIALKAAIEFGRKHTVIYSENEYPILPVLGSVETLSVMADDDNGSLSVQAYATEALAQIEAGLPFDPVVHGREVRVTKHKTFEAAMALHKEFPNKKIAVLNFASAIQPGGGVKHGSSAQEESLCRCSTLFPTIDRKWLWQSYYDVNRAKTDDSIPQRMEPKDFVTVDVISCAAPNLRDEPANFHNPETGAPVKMDPTELYELHLKRAEHILHIAAYNNVDILILGAFGCGAFCNDPNTVASAYRDALESYIGRFDLIEFAIYCRDFEAENYEAFNRILNSDNF